MLIATQRIGLSQLLFALFDYVLSEHQAPKVESRELVHKTPQQQLSLIASNYVDRLYRYVRYTFSLSQDMAEDIVQDIFLHLHKKIQKFDMERAFEPWLYRVTHNHTIDYLRKQKNHQHAEQAPVSEYEFISKISTYEGDDLSADVEQVYKDSLLKVLLHKLQRRNREILILYYFEHKPYEEIATVLGVKASGVGTLLARAKKELKTHIDTDDLLHKALVYDLDLDT